MTRTPNFFIIGAPKCGTTSLSEYLRAHPDVFFSTPKEPDHFDPDYPIGRRMSDEEYVRTYFSGATNEKAVGEGSTHYLSSDVAVKNILAFEPAARFIVMLRNPVEMAVSLYAQERALLTEPAPSFEEAWDAQPVRQTASGEKSSLQYGRICKVGAQVKRLFETVPRTQVMVIDFERFVRETDEVYADVLAFLDLENDGRSRFDRANPSRRARSGMLERIQLQLRDPRLRARSAAVKDMLGIAHWPALGRLDDYLRKTNLRVSETPRINAGLAQSLYRYFEEDVRLVKELTGVALYDHRS